jgi:hypothetical protein
MGSAFVRFEKTTLDDVLKAAKAGAIGHHGDAAGSEYFLCFTHSSTRQPFRVWIISSGEMGGPEHAVTEVVAQRLESSVAAGSDCPPLPPSLRPTALDRGIWIGTTRDELGRKLGRHSASRDGWLVFNFLGTVPGPYNATGTSNRRVADWDVTNFLETRIKNGRIDAIWAGRVTSY